MLKELLLCRPKNCSRLASLVVFALKVFPPQDCVKNLRDGSIYTIRTRLVPRPSHASPSNLIYTVKVSGVLLILSRAFDWVRSGGSDEKGQGVVRGLQSVLSTLPDTLVSLNFYWYSFNIETKFFSLVE